MICLVTILLVEERLHAARELQQVLGESGVTSRVRWVADAAEAQAYLLGEGRFTHRARYPFPDVILVDRDLGAEKCAKLMQVTEANPDWRGVPIALLNGAASATQKPIEQPGRVKAVFPKPFRAEDVAQLCAISRGEG